MDHDTGDPAYRKALSREIDAWLRGDLSRRGALGRLLGLAAGGTLLAGPAFATSQLALRHANSLLHQAKVDLASPDTPLGRAQADAVHASTQAPQDGSAFRAVAAAKKFKGATISMTYEAGLQALEPRNFSGPLWQDLTGISSNVVELSHPDQYSKPIAEHIAQSGAYDVIDIEPDWIPSLADGGVIAPIDDYVGKYMNKADLDDYHPLYKNLPTYKGKRWGFFDDGDQWALYYRRDLFEDGKLKAAYRAKFNQDLQVPRTWDEYNQVAQFITDQLAPKVYGAAHFRKAGSPGNQFAFAQQFRANGGKFFDEKTMKAQLNTPAGVLTLKQMVAANKASIPGNNDLDAVAQWAAWLQGKVAMIFSWPPTGRMSENYAQRDKAINFVPSSAIAGKVGYTVVPGGNGEMASGYVKALTTDSQNAEAAYLFMQWSTSPPVSLVRVMLPYTLRDPYRLSHYTSPIYRSLWPSAKEYLIALSDAANGSVVDLVMPGAQDYALTLDRMCTAVWAGEDPAPALTKADAEWDAITARIGVDTQR
ncbi:MAG TPA: extracellular solute-binding protein, partial [Acetobacteraceae bacterium]|nr:extracellular solute-binding protein [Acetobacteraceae bacterium]